MNDYIRKAERDLAAATAYIGVAESQLYPSIALSGSISPSLGEGLCHSECGRFGYNFGGPRSGQILMNTESHAVAAMDKRWIGSDNLPFGRVS